MSYKFSELCDLCKRNKKLRNNKELAKYLGFASEQGFYDMKNGRGGLKDAVVRRLMESCELEAHEVEAAWKAEHARDEAVRRSWRTFLEQSQTRLNTLPLLSFGLIAGILADTYQCILCQILRPKNKTHFLTIHI
jgi:hypothetical protein